MVAAKGGFKGISWEPLEPSFRLLLPALLEGQKTDSQEEELALRKIRLALVAAAARVFRSPGFRGVDCDPEAAAQMWFVQIRRAKRSYDADKPFHKLAYKILGNLCRDLGRRARVRQAQSIAFEPAAASETPWRLAVRREDRLRVHRALRSLKQSGRMSRKQRVAIACKYYRGMSSKDVGKRLGVTAAAVDVLTLQARALLREELRARA